MIAKNAGVPAYAKTSDDTAEIAEGKDGFANS